ncbi:hypothetical protein D9M68_971940 [compost metagenome]
MRNQRVDDRIWQHSSENNSLGIEYVFDDSNHLCEMLCSIRYPIQNHRIFVAQQLLEFVDADIEKPRIRQFLFENMHR